MKTKYLFLPAIVAFASMLSSCEDEILLEEELIEQKTKISKTEVTVEEPVEPVGRLVSATMLSQPVPAGTAISNVMNAVPSGEYEGLLVGESGGDLLASPEFLKCDLLGIDMQLETYRIRYRSMGGAEGKEPVILTGDIAFIANADHSNKRKLESVSLFHTTFNPSESTSYTWEEMIFPTRAAFNALVVYPFYQGSFSDKGDKADGHTICVSEQLIKARQAIDCELAALEFLETLDHVEMEKCYYTENMGVSNGAGATLATQYLLENDPEYRAINRSLIHLKGTFCSEGCYSWGDLMNSVLTTTGDDVPLGDESVDGMKPVALISCLIGAYDTWKDKYFDGIELESFFNEEKFLKKPMLLPMYTFNYSWGMEYKPYSVDMSTMTPEDWGMMGEMMGLDPELCASIGELAGKLELNAVSSSLAVSLLGLAASVVGAVSADDSTAIYNQMMADYYYQMAAWGYWDYWTNPNEPTYVTMGTDPISLFRSGDFDNSRPDIATLKIQDILNPELLTSDGKRFNTSAPQIIALNKCFKENDVITNGWNPATPLLIVHSSADTFVDIRQPQSVYKSLSNNGRNRNVKLRDARILGHMSGTVVGILEIMFLKHPCPID